MAASLELSAIRETLIRQEDTIIFALIERAQFAHNASAYDQNEEKYNGLTGGDASLLDFLLLETERLHARIRRYTSPDEHPFFPHRLPAPQLPLLNQPQVLHPTISNLNSTIMDMYLTKVLPGLCRPGDDAQHGSSVVADIAVLQAISKRVHYGFFVAESKFLAQRQEFTALIEAKDEEGIMALLTHAAVEARVLRRVHAKASTFGQELEAPPAAAAGSSAAGGAPVLSARVNPDLIERLYYEHVIPLTKVAEVQYLMQRLGEPNVAHHGAAGSVVERAAVVRFRKSCPEGKTPPALLRCSSVAEVGAGLLANKAHYGVVLLELGDSGVLSSVRMLLKENADLRIVDEMDHETRFKLLATGSAVENVRRVVGRAEVLRLCAPWLRSLLIGSAELVEAPRDVVDDPAALWESEAQQPDELRAATAYVVECYQGTSTPGLPAALPLQVLAHAPEDVVEFSRCVVLARGREAGSESPSSCDKTILSFSLSKTEAGGLAAALSVLHQHGVNLLSIRSYLDLHDRTKVDFVATMHGHEKEPALSAAIEELKGIVCAVRVLGSYALRRGLAAPTAVLAS